MEKHSIIVKKKDGYYLLSKDRAKNLGGPYPDETAARRREHQVEYFKNRDALKTAAQAANSMPGAFHAGSSFTRMPSPTANLKSTLTKNIKAPSSDAAGRSLNPPTQFEAMYPATAKHYAQQQSMTPGVTPMYTNMRSKASGVGDIPVSTLSSYAGYRPGVWYGDGAFGPDGERRMGNLITGAGLSALGLATIPALQSLFPERFKRKTGPLATLAVAGGMSLPWLARLPSTMKDIGRIGTGGVKDPYAQYSTPQQKASSFIPDQLAVGKAHLNTLLLDSLRSGQVDYGQVAGLADAANQAAGSRPWFTVGDLARVAVGSGAGYLAGRVAAKGIGLFANVSDKERDVLAGTGAALGSLITLGKFSM